MNVHAFAGVVLTIAVVVSTLYLLTGRWHAYLATMVIAIMAGLLWEATDGES